MARGRDRHDARKAAIAALGRSLSRRAGSRCELCDGATDLRVVEVPPVEEEPSEESAILACASCRDLPGARRLPDPDTLRFLETAVWSEVMPAQIAAVRLARRLAGEGVSWAAELLEGLWLDDEVTARVEADG